MCHEEKSFVGFVNVTQLAFISIEAISVGKLYTPYAEQMLVYQKWEDFIASSNEQSPPGLNYGKQMALK